MHEGSVWGWSVQCDAQPYCEVESRLSFVTVHDALCMTDGVIDVYELVIITCLWWSLCALHLLACKVIISVRDSGLYCYTPCTFNIC